MSANANVKCDFASLKYEQLLRDKYFVQTCFSKSFDSYPPKEVLNDMFMVLRTDKEEKKSTNKQCYKEEPCITTSTSTTTTLKYPNVFNVFSITI